jgi:hypothetical protein
MRGPTNPIATPDQAEVERAALHLLEHPTLRRTREEVRARWLAAARPSAEMRERFEASFAEVMFCAAVWSLNQDPERPRVVTITRLRHRLGELEVPGSRYGLDNPDSIYRVIPIDGRERYVIRGTVAERRLTENHFTLWDRSMNTVDVLDGSRLALGPGGRFEISVDSEPANGRANHVRSSPAAHEFYIRDVILDWANDRPNTLEIERLGGPPKKPALGPDEQAELTARFMRSYADNTVRWNQQALQHPANAFAFTIDRDSDGALRNQVYILGHFRLRDEEALVVRATLGGAAYFIAPITNFWGTTNDIANRTASLNKAQMVPDADGAYTFVVSAPDPGVHNWVDPCDLHEGILTLRWAEFPGGRPSRDLAVASRVVPLARLREELPAHTRFVTPAERKEQQAERARSYAWRLLEG